MNRGEIKQLFIFGGDPVYNAPRAVAQDPEKKFPLDWADLQKKVPDVVRLGYHEDATSAMSQWHVPVGALSRVMGRRARRRRFVFVDPADDSAVVRRVSAKSSS